MLIKNISDFKNHVSVFDMDIKSLKPYILAAEEEFIIPIIGQELYDALDAAYNSNVVVPADLAKLLAKVQLPLANLAFNIGAPFLNIEITDSGINTTASENKKAANEWAVDRAQRQAATIGDKGLDRLLEFLELNKDITAYAAWKADATLYTQNKLFFINSAKEFSGLFNIGGSRRTYQALLPILRGIEETQITKITGRALFNEMKTRILANGSTSDDAALFNYIKPALAYLTISRASLELSMNLTPEGMMITSYKSNTNNNRQVDPASESRLSTLRAETKAEGEAYLSELSDFLKKYASASRYASFYNDPLLYDQTALESSTKSYENDADSGIYVA
ncbi:MAG: hypothetical protein EOP53_02315 [Sphingobacteriales bacterium]|nr:MAG: hypothetical protein EOP53_02315 [Sphingobacteriales bacterium]